MDTETTPTGQSMTGYRQAIRNYVYQIDQLAIDIETEENMTAVEQVESLISRGVVWKKHQSRFVLLDEIIDTIEKTYGFDKTTIDRDIMTVMYEQVIFQVTGDK